MIFSKVNFESGIQEVDSSPNCEVFYFIFQNMGFDCVETR